MLEHQAQRAGTASEFIFQDSCHDPFLGTGSSSSSTIDCEVQTAFSVASPAKTFVVGTSLTGVVRLHVAVTAATAAGTIQLQASNISGSGTVTLKAGSDLVARRSGV